MRRLLLLVALAVAPAAACGSHETTSAAVVPGAPAGDVTELAGVVHAARGGATRTLARGDVVSGDDVITTGADGRVTIVLRHNHVPWSLGPSKTKQVSESVAWTATAAAGSADVGDDHSAAAGRHAERSATDTAATAPTPTPTTPTPPLVPTPAPAPGGSAAGSGSGSADTDGLVGALGSDDGALGGEGGGGLGLKGTGGGGGGGSIGLGQIGTLGHGAGGGAGQGYGAGGGRLGGGHATTAPKVTISATTRGELAAPIATRIVRRSLGRFRLCYENQLRIDPTAEGKVMLVLVVDATGAVTTSNVGASTIADDVGHCVARGVMGLSFPSGKEITLVTVTLTFAPGS